MSSARNASGKLIRTTPAVAALFLAAAFCEASSAQVRPTILDSGEVNVAKKQPVVVDRSQIGITRASKPANSILIILTEPSDAQVKINGKPAGRATGGKFKKELASRKRYSVSVSAGPDYETHDEVVTLKPGEPAVIEAALVSKFGTLRIFPAKEGVTILDNGKSVASEKLTTDKENRIVLDGLSPGKHEITYDLPGYLIYGRTFNVTAGSEHTWNLLPERAVVQVTIATDPKTSVYFDGKPVGTTPADGVLKQFVELGKHELKLVKDDFEEYAITLYAEYGKPRRIEKKLVPLPTSAEFSDDFDVPNPDLWTMPSSGARFAEGRLQLDNATTLCTPGKVRYRDFDMHFHLKLDNAAGAAWALRIRDSNDFYLFYLSGPEGLFPEGRFCTYIVRNNQFDPMKPFPSSPIIVKLVRGGQYEIHITAKGNRIEHQIKSEETGKPENLGFFEDPNNTFLLGGIGFRTVGREKFSIDDLFVRPR